MDEDQRGDRGPGRYLLAQEEALGGQDGEAVSRAVLYRGVWHRLFVIIRVLRVKAEVVFN